MTMTTGNSIPTRQLQPGTGTADRHPGQQFLRAVDAEGADRRHRLPPPHVSIDARSQIGVLLNRPVVVAGAYGGHVTSPPMQLDFVAPCLLAILETIGIHPLEFLRHEGMARGPEPVERPLDAAEAWIERQLPRLLGDR
jgi:hypothetical protein